MEFYRQNAAFFGLLFLVLFGFIKASEHIAIGSFLVANPSTLFFLYVLWIAYGIKVFLFVNPATDLKENQFLEVFILLPLSTKINVIATISVSLFLPIIAYAIFLVSIAVASGFYLAILSLLLAVAITIFLLSFMVLRKLNSIPREKSFIQFRFLNNKAKPPWSFFIEHLIRNDYVLLLLSKIYSCLIIIGASALYSTDLFDIRLLSTGVLLAFVGNTAILHKYVWFIYHKMKFSNNLPQSFLKLLFYQSLTFLVLLIPEFLVTIRHYPLQLNFNDVAGILLFGFSISLLIYGLLLLKQLELSDFVVRIFWLIVISTFLILFSIHPLLLAFLYIFIGVAITYFWRFKFEFIEKVR